MSCILTELWYGNIDPHESIPVDKRLLSLMGRNREKLDEILTEQQKELLEKYDGSVNEMHSYAEIEAFSYGFRLGVQLMTAAFINLE